LLFIQFDYLCIRKQGEQILKDFPLVFKPKFQNLSPRVISMFISQIIYDQCVETSSFECTCTKLD